MDECQHRPQERLICRTAVYNRTASRAEQISKTLPEGQTKVAYSIEEAVKDADIIFAIVSDDAAIEETLSHVLNAPGGIKGKLFVDCTTVAHRTTTKIAALLTDAGGEFIAMPVFGTATVAETSQLICAPAGPKASVDKIRPFLKQGVICRSVIDLSDHPCSKASILKILGNSLVANLALSISKVFVLAEKSNLGTEYLQEFVKLQLPGLGAALSQAMTSGKCSS